MILTRVFQNKQKKCSQSQRIRKVGGFTVRHSSYLTRPVNPPSPSIDELKLARQAFFQQKARSKPTPRGACCGYIQADYLLSAALDQKTEFSAAATILASNDN